MNKDEINYCKLNNCAHESLQSNIKIINSSDKGRCAVWNGISDLKLADTNHHAKTLL